MHVYLYDFTCTIHHQHSKCTYTPKQYKCFYKDFRFLKNTSMKRFTINFGTFLQNKIISIKNTLVGKGETRNFISDEDFILLRKLTHSKKAIQKD